MTDEELLSEIRRLNVVVHEDADTITAISPCPTAAHRPAKVLPKFAVRFACPHGESVSVFCEPCTADRRAGRWACREWTPYTEDCYSTVVEVWTVEPYTRQKVRRDR